MPRPPRQEVADGVHHVFARGNRRQRIYDDDLDRRIYLSLLGRVVRDKRWRVLAYCLMENHVHLLIQTPEPNLGSGMQRLHSAYAQLSNERHGRSGHLFQGRYGSVPVQTDEQLWTVARYIALNPVEAGLCSAPTDWRWSSHEAILGGPRPAWLDVPRLLAFFGAAGGEPRERYRAFVEGSA
jgi:REP element-mobilizing transposase RayT